MKVAIIGAGDIPDVQGPFDEPMWNIWGMNHGLVEHVPRYTRWFEMHSYPLVLDTVHIRHRYLEFLETCPVPLVMQERHVSLRSSAPFPLKEAIAIGDDYFTCTVAYMIAHALVLDLACHPDSRLTHLGLWGVTVEPGTEYADQRACIEWWLGIARGMGVKVSVHGRSQLLKATRYAWP